MRIKINKTKHKIKSSQQLTCKEYIELISNKKGVNVLSYLNATMDVNFSDIQNLEFKRHELSLINTFIGEIPDVNFFFKKGKAQQKFVFNNELYDLEKETSVTLGTRQAYSDFTKGKNKNAYEAALFLLAVIMNNLANTSLKYDNDSVQRTYEELLNKNYLDTFPSAVFFLKRLTNG